MRTGPRVGHHGVMTRPRLPALTTVGLVRTERTETERTPIQSALNVSEHGTVEVFEEYAEGLDGLAGFDHAWLLCWLDQAEADPPRCDRCRSCCGPSSVRSVCSRCGARVASIHSA